MYSAYKLNKQGEMTCSAFLKKIFIFLRAVLGLQQNWKEATKDFSYMSSPYTCIAVSITQIIHTRVTYISVRVRLHWHIIITQIA